MNNNVVNKYLNCKEFPVDDQLLLLSNEKLLDVVTIDVLLSQFKYCRTHHVGGRVYDRLRGHLVKVLGESTVKDLEVIN